jgi:DNA-directed RNA polymerase specialized sigma24 family protein
LIPGLREGDRQAIGRLWERYFSQMLRVAQSKLYGALRFYAHDVAMDAFLKFCARAAQGKFPDLDERMGLIKLLTHITICESFDFLRRPWIRRELAASEILDHFLSREPPPEFENEVTALLDKLPDDDLRKIALLRMEGLTRQEIAARCGCGVATVYRRLAMIRCCWRSDWENLLGA